MRPLVIAIDGPSGVGKGTVSRAIARALGYRHVDTGAMYRAIAWLALERGVDLDEEASVSPPASAARVEVDDGRVVIDGIEVTPAIRTPAIDRAVTSVARLPAVRQLLVARQRSFGDAGGVVMEGRDIGSVVFPSADVKIYLDASPEERARRRAADPAHAAPQPLSEVASALATRDRIDSTRAASPLTIAPDAEVIDTTGVPVDEVVQRVLEIIRRAE
jgi:cytidylate kinase